MTSGARRRKTKGEKAQEAALVLVFWNRVMGLLVADFDTEGLWDAVREATGVGEDDEIPPAVDTAYHRIALDRLETLARTHGAGKQFNFETLRRAAGCGPFVPKGEESEP